MRLPERKRNNRNACGAPTGEEGVEGPCPAWSEKGMQASYSLITLTPFLLDPFSPVWLTDVLARIADLPQSRLHELLPWNWKAARESQKSP